MKKKNQAQTSTKEIAASLTLVTKANAPFANAVRLTAIEKQRAAKMKRGAPQVMPTIAHVATKFAVEVPGMSIADMQSTLDYAGALEPLLGAVSALHETLRDEYLRANCAAWATASVTYAMLKKATKANQNLANELAPVQKWFRRGPQAKKAKDQTSASATSPKSSSSTTNVPAKTNGAANEAPVTVAPVTTPAGPAVVNGAPSNGAALAN